MQEYLASAARDGKELSKGVFVKQRTIFELKKAAKQPPPSPPIAQSDHHQRR
jgi:hypothetical protein